MYFPLMYKRNILLLFILMIALSYFGQQSKGILPQTIILKVKETHRSICLEKKIEHNLFNDVISVLGVNQLQKVFPNKQKERVKGNIDLSLIYQLTYTNPYSEEEAIRKLKKLKLFNYVERYVIPELTYTPNDTLLPQLYHLGLIDAYNAWDINQGDVNITIGITDTGWDPAHPDLLPNVQVNTADPINGLDDDNDGFIDNNMGWDLGMNDNNALFESVSHGVNVTGLAAAATDNITGIAGVGFDTKFLPIKISNAAGILTHAYQGIVYAADHDCFVINCSWGGYVFSQFNKDVIDYAIINKGAVVVAAAGNDNQTNPFYPASYDGVINVAATDQNDVKKNTSNFGYHIQLSAPGESLLSTTSVGSYAINSGTSIAAPLVSGAAAIVKAQFPSYNNYQVAAVLRATADDLNGTNPTYLDQLGTGRLNLFNALSNTTVQFTEMISESITDNNNQVYEVGDTLRIVGTFVNYLTTMNGLSATITSLSPFVNILDGTTNLPSLNMLDTALNASDPFLIEVLTGAALNEEVLFKIVLTNGTFNHVQYLTITLNPDFINVAENQISTTITSTGKIGFNDQNNTVGLGFTYRGEQLLYEAGLMVGDGANRVADVVRGMVGQDQDFSSINNVNVNPPFISALDLIGKMDDSPLTSSMDLEITHYAYAYPNSPDDKYVIVAYDIENTGSSNLTNLYAGIFADWDIVDANANKTAYDAGRKMGYAHSLNTDTIYTAIQLLSSSSVNNYGMDLDGSGGIDVGGGFSSSEKYGTLSTSRNSSGGLFGGDIAHVVSSGNFNLNPGDHEIVVFALIAGDSLIGIQASADAAQIKYLNDPLSIDELVSEKPAIVYPNPTKGNLSIKSSRQILSIFLKNILGESMEQFNTNIIDISNYPNGIYFIEVLTEEGQFSEKVILAK